MFNKEFEKEVSSKEFEELKEKVDALYVVDYFAGCCGSRREIIKAEAVSFRKSDFWYGRYYTVELYTSKENYENHLPVVKKFEAEVLKNEKEKDKRK